MLSTPSAPINERGEGECKIHLRYVTEKPLVTIYLQTQSQSPYLHTRIQSHP
jgi:hypothetical protein